MENKENKTVDEVHEHILQQKPGNTKVKTQSDMKARKRFCAIAILFSKKTAVPLFISKTKIVNNG